MPDDDQVGHAKKQSVADHARYSVQPCREPFGVIDDRVVAVDDHVAVVRDNGIPCASASAADMFEVGPAYTRSPSRPRRPSARGNHAPVEPVPIPTTIPVSTSSAAASPAARLAASTSMVAQPTRSSAQSFSTSG